ncbi:MAG: HEPN domain-containing protein [Thermoplasmata archaeon]
MFLEIAKVDFRAAKLLYGDRLYTQALFYLQQSSEKATKSFCLMSRLLDTGEVKNVRHDAIKIFNKAFVKFKKEYDENMLSCAKDLTKKMKVLEFINKFNNCYIKNFDEREYEPDKETIDIFIKKLDEIWSDAQASDTQRESAAKIFRELSYIVEEKKKEALKLSAELSSAPFNLEYIISSLFVLSVVMHNVAVRARYPLIKSDSPLTKFGYNPIRYYDEENDIIKSFESLMGILERTLKSLDDTLKNKKIEDYPSDVALTNIVINSGKFEWFVEWLNNKSNK